MTRFSRRAALTLVAVTMACGDHLVRQGPEAPGGPGGVHLTNSPPYPTCMVDTVPALEVGAALDGNPEQHFADVRYAGALSDGGLVLVSGASSEILWFDARGQLSTRAGRRGAGPEELGYVMGATLLRGDTLLLFDADHARLTWFDAEGSFVRTRRLDLGWNLDVRLYGVDAGRIWVVMEKPVPHLGGLEYNFAQDSIHVLLLSDVAGVDTVLRLPGRESVTWVDYVAGRPRGTRQMDLPFGHRTLVGGLRESIVVSRSDDGGLVFSAPDGTVLRSAHRTDVAPIPVSGEVRRRYLEAELARLAARRVPPAMARRGAEERLGLLPDGRTQPVYDNILVDAASQRVWLRDYLPVWGMAGPQAWTVHGDGGRVVCRVATPAGLQLQYIAGERLVGIRKDDMGVEYVGVYRIRPPGA